MVLQLLRLLQSTWITTLHDARITVEYAAYPFFGGRPRDCGLWRLTLMDQ